MLSERDTVLHSWCRQADWSAPTIVGGAGARIHTADGRSILDMSSLAECSNLGHQHPKVIAAIRDQAQKLCFVTSAWGAEPRAKLAELLLEKSGFAGGRVFFTLGGADANENAVKFARQASGKPRGRIIARDRSYHGATYAAMALSGDSRTRHQVDSDAFGVLHAPPPYAYRCPFGSPTAEECGNRSAAFVGASRNWTFTPGAGTVTTPVDVEVLESRPAPAEGLFSPSPNASNAPAFSAAGPVRDSTASDVPPLLQLRRTYLMFERAEGVVLIDQHSAHERILFEQFMHVLERGAAPSQRLLFPATLHLGPAEADAFEANRETLVKLGFEIEPFGGHSIIISAVPMPHPRFDALRCLRDTLDALTGDRVPSAAARHERLAATVACKAAIKGGDSLSPAEMQALYVGLAATTLPAHDVHGRSTIVQITWDELERRFGRK